MRVSPNTSFGRAVAIAFVLTIVISSLSGAAGAQPKKGPPAFPDGTWQGATLSAGGTIAGHGAFGASGADVTFELFVADQLVDDGTMNVEGSSGSKTPNGSATVVISGIFTLSGTASEILFEGTMSSKGSVTAFGLTQPIDSSAPGNGQFSPKTATCSRATGDIAIEGRKIQQAAGFSTDVRADFVALRVKGVDADKVLQEFQNTVEDINATLADVATGDVAVLVEDLFALVQRVNELLRRIVNLKACGALPRGFEPGFADPYFSAVFRNLVGALLARAEELSPAQLLTVIYMAYEVGAIGASAPDPGAAAEVQAQAIDALNAAIDAALAAGDVDALIEISAAAQQLGLDDVFAKANQALDQLLGTKET